MNVKEKLMNLKKELLLKENLNYLINNNALKDFIIELKGWGYSEEATKNMLMATLTELINLVYYPIKQLKNGYIEALGEAKIGFEVNHDAYMHKCQNLIPDLASLFKQGYNSIFIQKYFEVAVDQEVNNIYLQNNANKKAK
jgi:hypothetical protein